MPRKRRRPRTRFTIEDKRVIARIQGQIGLVGGICQKCGRDFPIDIMQVDHIVPISRGGTDRPTNLRLLCPTCNRKKGAKKPTKPRYYIEPLTGARIPVSEKKHLGF